VFGGAITADNNKYSTLFMSNYLDIYVKDSLKRIPGVADVIIFGERKYSMRLWLDPVRMAGRGLTARMSSVRCRSKTSKSQPPSRPAARSAGPAVSNQRARRRQAQRDHPV